MFIFSAGLVIVICVAAWFFYKKSNRFATRSGGPTLRLHGGEKYEYAIVGVARFRPALEEICDDTRRDSSTVEAVLVPDDGGRDRKAVRVDVQGHTVGYLPAGLAEAYRKRLVESGYPNARSICKAKIIVRAQGVSGSEYAVRLDLPQKQ